MAKIIHIAELIVIVILIIFLQRACSDVKETVALWKGEKLKSEKYKEEAEEFKKKLAEELKKPPKVVIKTKIVEKTTGAEVVEIPAECETCFQKYKREMEVCDENTGICYTDDNIFDSDFGIFHYTERFYSLLSDLYRTTRERTEDRIFRIRFGVIAESHYGVGAYTQIVNLKRILAFPLGVGMGLSYDLKASDVRFIAGLNYNFWGNLYVSGGYGRSIQYNYGYVGIGVWIK